MTHRFAAAVVFAAGLGLVPAVLGQDDAVERLADGRPDMNGIWQALNEANWNLEPHAASPAVLAQLGAQYAVPPGIGVVVGGEIPYLPEALARRDENFANRLELDPEVKCYMPGVPRATYMPYPFQIIQSQDVIMFAYEFAGAVRVVNMGAPTRAPADSWMGWSNGRWEGDTLVIDVASQNGQTWLDRAGNHHSNATHVVERYTRMGPNILMYEATIEDPNTFSRPWTIRMPLYRRVEENAQLMEFKCPEFAEEVLYGHLRRQPED